MSACADKKKEVVKIKDKNFSGMLMVQKMKDNTGTEEMTKIIRDKQKIEKILTMVDGLKVVETKTEKMTDALKAQDSYFFTFAEGEKFEYGKPAPYVFIILNDGTFFFSYKDVNSLQKPRMTIVEHKELLNETKQLLGVNF
jgi:translation initiation factor 1 (eIF-1/SUI1)